MIHDTAGQLYSTMMYHGSNVEVEGQSAVGGSKKNEILLYTQVCANHTAAAAAHKLYYRSHINGISQFRSLVHVDVQQIFRTYLAG
jgi:hypothetical protein